MSFTILSDEPASWMLGVKYDDDDLDGWTSDYRSIPWLTYRNGFKAMEPYCYTDDAGWGCMLRSAQMMMAHAFLRHRLGRHWRAPWDFDRLKECPAFCDMMMWFADCPGRKCLYSLHNMVQIGMNYDKLPGEWYGPSTSAYVLRDLALVHRECLGGSLRVMVTQAEVVYIDDVRRACHHHIAHADTEGGGDGTDPLAANNDGAGGEEARPPPTAQGSNRAPPLASEPAGVLYDPLLNLPPRLLEEERRRQLSSTYWGSDGLLILIPLRLGLAGLNPIYIPGLQATLQFPQSVGFIGGKPNHALYFVGMRGTELTGLDPHTVQTAPQVSPEVLSGQCRFVPSEAHIRSVQCRSPQTMQFKDLDPSLALGFYIRNEGDFDDFASRAHSLKKLLATRGLPPPFTVEQAPPDFEGAASVASLISAMNDEDSDGDEDLEDEYVIVR